MGCVSSVGIDEAPDFGGVQDRLFGDRLVPVGSVQQKQDRFPLRVHVFVEGEHAGLHRPRFRNLRHRPQCRRQRTVVLDLAGRDPKLHDDEGIVLQDNLLAAMLGEIHDEVCTLGGSKQYALERNRRRKQSLIGADLVKAEPVLKSKMVKASIRSVEHAKAIFARLDFEVRKQLSVHQNGVAKNLGNPRRLGLVGDGVVKLAVRSQQAVEERQRHFVFSAGQMQRILDGVADEERPKQAGINVEPVDAHGVVVIPEHRRVLLIGIVVEHRLAGNDPVLRIPVAFRRCLGAVQVSHGAGLRLIAFGPVKPVVNGQEVLLRQFVRPLHEQPIAAARFKRGPGNGAAIRPEARRFQIAMDLHFQGLRRHAIVRQLDLRRGGQRPRAERLCNRRHGQGVHERLQCGGVKCIRLRAHVVGHRREGA